MSWLSTLTVVGTALGGVGGTAGCLAAVFKLLVPFLKERRLNRVTTHCLEAKGKADREYFHALLRTTLSQSGELALGMEQKPKTPSPRRESHALTSASLKPKSPTSS